MRTKTAFVPESLGRLEDRTVPAATFYNGVAVLTTNVYWNAVHSIQNSFAIFGSNLNYGQLYNNLLASVRSIPYHHTSGLDNSMLVAVWQVEANLINHTPFPLISAQNQAIAALNANVSAMWKAGQIIIV